MGILNETIPRTSIGAIASYDFTSLLTKTGYVNLYGTKNQSGYALTPNNVYSETVMTVTTSSAGTDTIQHDVDFDIQFNTPQNLKGNLIANVPVGIRNTAGSAQSYNLYVKVYVRKWNGTTETEIANATGTTLAWGGTTTANGAQATAMLSVSINVPLTHFKIGEYLRITTEVHGWNGGAASEYYLGHDPKNRATDLKNFTLSGAARTFGNDPTTLLILTPFRADIS